MCRKFRFFYVLPVLMLIGCTSQEVRYVPKPVRVEVPVIVPCRVVIPAQLDYATELLHDRSTDFEKIKALLVERRERAATEGELRELLGVCATP